MMLIVHIPSFGFGGLLGYWTKNAKITEYRVENHIIGEYTY